MEDMTLDGNAAAGILGEVFVSEVTTAVTTCATCGAVAPIGGLRAYLQAPGAVLRCVTCGAVQVAWCAPPTAPGSTSREYKHSKSRCPRWRELLSLRARRVDASHRELVGSQIRAAGGAASDDARWVVVVQDLQYLGTSVGLEGMSRVFGQAERIARPSRSADLDHNVRNLRTPGDLPEPTARVDTPTHMRPEVRSDLPAHHARSMGISKALFGLCSGPSDLTRDDILDNITLSWSTSTGVSSARLYVEYKGAFFNDFNALHKGGHFAAWEQPQLFSEEVRTGFRSLRG